MKRLITSDLQQLSNILQRTLHQDFELKLQINRAQAEALVEFCELNGLPSFNKALEAMLIEHTAPLKDLAFARFVLEDFNSTLRRVIQKEMLNAVNRVDSMFDSVTDSSLKDELDQHR